MVSVSYLNHFKITQKERIKFTLLQSHYDPKYYEDICKQNVLVHVLF